eukprot:scaffold4590_cov112-Cylindrotheca_fusiformis.AAC.9
MGNCVGSTKKDRTLVDVAVQTTPSLLEDDDVFEIGDPSDDSFEALYPDLKVSRKQDKPSPAAPLPPPPPPLSASTTSHSTRANSETSTRSSITRYSNGSENSGSAPLQQPPAPMIRMYGRQAPSYTPRIRMYAREA